MGKRILLWLGTVVAAGILIIATAPTASAQGKGHGGGGGGGGGRGASPGGPPSGVGVDRGIGRSSDASVGRADTGRGNASERSNGRSDAGLERARMANDNLKTADNDLRKHPNIARDLRVNANDLRAGYQTALQSNPNLTFGNYVAATRLAQNLGRRNPAITRAAILAGLANGDSIGRTLQNLGLSKDQTKAEMKRIEMQNKESKRRD
jgi:hypothetical protein